MTTTLKLKRISGILWGIFFLAFTFMPVLALGAESDLSKNNNTGITYECVDKDGTPGNCDFHDLLTATQKAVKYAVQITLGLCVLVIAYAGWLYMISGANPSKRTEANLMLKKVAIGIFFILAAWFIVSMILNALKVDSPVKF
jgi:hypothetical protein